MPRLRRTVRNILAVTVVGVALGFAVAKAYVWYEAYRAAQQLAEWVAPHAAVSWQSVSADVDGEIRLGGLSIQPVGINDELFVELLTVHIPGQRDALALVRNLVAGNLPETLRLGAQGVMLNTDGTLYRRLAQSRWWGTPTDAAGCVDTEHLRSDVLQAVGRDSIVADAEFLLRLHQNTGRLALHLDMTVPGLSATTVDAMLTLGHSTPPEGTETALAAFSPALTSLRLRTVDLGFNEARNYYCAAQLDIPMPAFVDRHMDAVRKRFAAGDHAAPEATDLTGYRLFATRGGDLLLDLMPVAPVPLATLRQASAEDFIQTMRPRLAVNGRPIPIPMAIWRPTSPAAEPPHAERAIAVTGSMPIPATDLAAYVGASVRVLTRDGTAHTGIIEAVSADRLTLRRRLEGGHMSFSIPPGEIQQVVRLSSP